MDEKFNIEQFLLKKYSNKRIHNKNDFLYSNGGFHDGVFFITKGKIKIMKESKKSQMTLWFAQPKEFVGITSFFDNNYQYSFNAIISEHDVETIFINNQH